MPRGCRPTAPRSISTRPTSRRSLSARRTSRPRRRRGPCTASSTWQSVSRWARTGSPCARASLTSRTSSPGGRRASRTAAGRARTPWRSCSCAKSRATVRPCRRSRTCAVTATSPRTGPRCSACSACPRAPRSMSSPWAPSWARRSACSPMLSSSSTCTRRRRARPCCARRSSSCRCGASSANSPWCRTRPPRRPCDARCSSRSGKSFSPRLATTSRFWARSRTRPSLRPSRTRRTCGGGAWRRSPMLSRSSTACSDAGSTCSRSSGAARCPTSRRASARSTTTSAASWAP
mmetsp:Transcript_11060/g.45932  ORF Transcript_11060/g.45932 Transcript_11060/m.45932 type:complete len:291 (+) Transcript_11060:2060-2932(+)